MEKELYQPAEMDLVVFDTEDVIVTSGEVPAEPPVIPPPPPKPEPK